MPGVALPADPAALCYMQLESAKAGRDAAAIAEAEAQLDKLGGRASYQAASELTTARHRTSKWVFSVLTKLGLRPMKGQPLLKVLEVPRMPLATCCYIVLIKVHGLSPTAWQQTQCKHSACIRYVVGMGLSHMMSCCTDSRCQHSAPICAVAVSNLRSTLTCIGQV